MTESQTGRMLLSHNFAIDQSDVPAMSRAEFTQVMVDGLVDHTDMTCTHIENPHWIVEVRFDPTLRSPKEVGELCATALVKKRSDHKSDQSPSFQVLALGGIKTSPAAGPNPTSLQVGEWGVDVIETPSGDDFLKGIDWDATISANPPDSIFKVNLIVA